MDTRSIKLMTKKDLEINSIWRFDDRDEMYYPVRNPEELPEHPRDTRIKVKFCTPSGLKLDGFIVGMNNIFSIGIFIDDKKFRFNKNLPDLSYEQFEMLRSSLPKGTIKTVNDVFPLTFETDFHWEDLGYNNFIGKFDPFEKVRDKMDELTKK